MPPNHPHLSWYKGRILVDNILDLKSDDPALLYGASTFTTMRVYHQSLEHPLTNWSAHYQRLSRSLSDLDWEQPDWQRVRLGIEMLLPRYPIIRVAIFPDGGELISGRNLADDLSIRQSEGITALMVEYPQSQRTLGVYKTGNYLPCWLALRRAQKIGAQEAILVDSRGNWLETSTGNLWGWQNGQWWTPSLDGRILPGICRAQLINWLSERDLPVTETTWNPDFAANLETLAYSNCAIEIVPIHTVICHNISKAYPVNKTALDQLNRFFATLNV